MVYYFAQDLSAAKHERQTEAAHAALLLALRREYGLTELPVIASDDRGKPYFPERPDLCFNYSHCRAGILVGIGKTDIGVDAETVREFRDSLAERVCHSRELTAVLGQPDRNLALTKLWTAKEAYLKYTGEGIRRDLRELDVADILMKNPDALRTERETRTEDGLLEEGRLRLECAYLCLWVLDNVCLCACSPDPEALYLYRIAAET